MAVGFTGKDSERRSPRPPARFQAGVFLSACSTGDELAEAVDILECGELCVDLSGLSVGLDLLCVEEEFPAANDGAEGVELALGDEVSDGALRDGEDAGGVKRRDEEGVLHLRGGGLRGVYHRGGKK